MSTVRRDRGADTHHSTIPLTEVVDCKPTPPPGTRSQADPLAAFQILHSTQGAQGILGHPSKQQLENEFGTSKDVEVVQQILEKGKVQSADGITTLRGLNDARGSRVIDNKGKGLQGI